MTIYIYASIMSMITFKTWSGQERFIPHWETKKDLGKFSIGAIALFFVIYCILRFKLAAPSPVLDAMHFTLKIGAYIFTARKSIESLLCFVAGDTIMVGMFAYTQQFILSSSYVVYVIIQFKGFLDWKKIIDNNKL
jgi:nicotinamide riboside transporter PnuC